MNHANCTIHAIPDLYGIGFRVGTYCQWLATLLAGAALPDEAGTMHANTICFQCAVLAALVLLTRKGVVQQPEVLVVILLAFGGFLAAQMFEYGLSGRPAKGTSAVRSFVVLQVFGGLIGYSLWFWWRGVGSLLPPAPASCVYYTFAFCRCPVASLRVFGIVMSIVGGALFVVAEALALTLPLLRSLRGGRKVALQHIITPSSPWPGHLWMPRSRIWLQMVLSVVSMCYLVVMVEMTLFWNPIVGANRMDSVGELLPLVIGATGLLRVLYILLREGLLVPITSHC
ncbi:hypothetical protein B0T18DRAFT_422555 [Schizothecium vesticola]|uniref:Uncharacterized protein n=1 Tax=Schizothecium vesticola TaxID=314040 RepID=A0AA40BQX8_9PEZI|nr:hypothetical protein B0T18DRAFT_422555 [Schizothecium vesticola]